MSDYYVYGYFDPQGVPFYIGAGKGPRPIDPMTRIRT